MTNMNAIPEVTGDRRRLSPQTWVGVGFAAISGAVIDQLTGGHAAGFGGALLEYVSTFIPGGKPPAPTDFSQININPFDGLM